MSKLVAILLSFVSLDVMAEVWFQTQKDGSPMECPDVVVISSSTYEILNDCYGLDRKHPSIESGSVSINDDTISFFEREVVQPTFVGAGERDVEFTKSTAGEGLLHLNRGPEVF